MEWTPDLCQRSCAFQRLEAAAPELGLRENFGQGIGARNSCRGRPSLFRSDKVWSDKGHLNSHLLQSLKVGLGDAVIGNDFMQRRGGDDQRQDSVGQTCLNRIPRSVALAKFDHNPVHLRFQQIRACSIRIATSKPSTPRNSISALSRRKRLFSDWPYQRKRVLAQSPAGQDHFYGVRSEFRCNVNGVRDNRKVMKAPQGARDGRGGCAGIENHDLAFLDLGRRGRPQSAPSPCGAAFPFAQGRVFQRTFASRQCAAGVRCTRPWACRTSRSFRIVTWEVSNFRAMSATQHSAIALQIFDNGPPAFFVEHVVRNQGL